MSVTNIHAPISAPSIKKADVDGGLVGNVAAILMLARENDTKECRFLTRNYNKEYRALEGLPMTPEARELQAFKAAWTKMHRELGTQEIAWTE